MSEETILNTAQVKRLGTYIINTYPTKLDLGSYKIAMALILCTLLLL